MSASYTQSPGLTGATRSRPPRRDGYWYVQGFTLIELLVTLTVVVILSTLAATSFSTTITNNRVYGIQTEFVGFLALARSEATRRGVPVVVTAIAPVAGNEYGGGWQIWV